MRYTRWGWASPQADHVISLAQSPHSPRPSQESSEGPDIRAVVEGVRGGLESGESFTAAHTRAPEPVLTSGVVHNTSATGAKLKDLFVPQEEQGVLQLANHPLSI